MDFTAKVHDFGAVTENPNFNSILVVEILCNHRTIIIDGIKIEFLS